MKTFIFIIAFFCFRTSKKCEAKKSSPKYTCGTLLDLSKNDIEHSSTSGFHSGQYIDGTDVYPGMGVFPMCGNSERVARISVDINIRGAHTPCEKNPGNEIFVSKRVKYFVETSNLKWKLIDFAEMYQISGSINVNNFFFFRVNFTIQGHTYQTIGLHHVDKGLGDPIFYWNGEETMALESGEVEILICD